ncbi:MAG: hypothetical protein AB1644_12020 [Candidatus Zixiibacteriota bacterium]
MKRLHVVAILAMLAASFQLLVNCSKPLESIDGQSQTPGVIVRVDTIVLTDTVIQTDTVVNTDTIIQTDTVVDVDTVYIELPDSCASQTQCARLNCYRKEIVWMFENPEGQFHLTFTARLDKDQPPQTLLVKINDQSYEWTPVDARVLEVDTRLSADASVVIKPENPQAFGHAIDICVTLTAR